jgi:hypothetical protein
MRLARCRAISSDWLNPRSFHDHVGEWLGEMQAMLILVALQHRIHRMGIAKDGYRPIEHRR